jgi:hypothetical protein
MIRITKNNNQKNKDHIWYKKKYQGMKSKDKLIQ